MSDFMTPGVHFDALVASLDSDEQAVYKRLRNTRQEVCFRGRSFVVYEIVDRAPRVLDHLRVLDFIANDSAGASCEIRSDRTASTFVVGYTPVQLFGYPIFAHLPLHLKLRWSTTPDNLEGGSLAFDLALRTASRLHLRERGVIYCETGVSFSKEFNTTET